MKIGDTTTTMPASAAIPIWRRRPRSHGRGSIGRLTLKIGTARARLRGLQSAAALAGALGCLAALPVAAQTDASTAEQEAATLATGGACGQTSQTALKACRSQALSDRSLSIGTCVNLGDAGDRSQCLRRADTAFNDAQDLCNAQLNARQQFCQALGDGPYDPPIKPADFTNRIDNPYLPLVPGTLFVYRSPHGLVNFEVTQARPRKIQSA